MVKRETKWLLGILLVFLIWGSFYPASKYIVTGVHPLLGAFLRYLFALLPMTPLFLREISRRGAPSHRDVGHLMLLGTLGVTVFAVLLFYGIKLSTSSLSSILANTQPIFAPLLARLMIGERFTARQFVGILVGMAGMSFVVTEGRLSGSQDWDAELLGNILCLLASVCISLYYTLLKLFVGRYGSTVSTYITFLWGALLLLIAALVLKADFRVLLVLGRLEWVLVVYNGVVATALVYLIHNRAISVIGVIKTIRLKFLVPVFGVLLSIHLLGEQGGYVVWTGLTVVAVSIFVVQWTERAGR